MNSLPPEALPVLVIDDDAQLLQTLRDILFLKGFEARTAATASDGLQIARELEEPPPVALVDLMLPDMHGLELAEHLHEISGLTQVVILTGNASVDSAVQAFRGRSFDYLVKPVAPDLLLRTIELARQRWHRGRMDEVIRRERERQAAILEACPLGIAIFTPEGVVEYINHAGEELLGLDPGAINVGPNVLVERLVPQRTGGGEGRRVIDHVLQTGHAVQDVRYTAHHPERGRLQLSVSGVPLEDHSGRITGVLETFTDITDRLRLEEEVRHAQKMDAVGRLAGGIAHDFNNLLTVIRGRADLILEDPSPSEDDVRDGLAAICEASDQASTVTRQLLTFSRRQPARVSAVDVNQVVRNLESLLDRVIGEAIRVRDDLAADLPAVAADPGLLQQVLMNLALNARDAMEGGGTLTFSTSEETEAETVPGGEERPRRWVRLAVADTGHGMDEATLQRIFEPFFTTKEAGRGTGLGLSTAYAIVTQGRGLIEVESEPGKGTTFRLRLPVWHEVEPGREGGAGPRDQSGTDRRRATVLVVDRQPAIRSLVKRILQREGYAVLEAGDGAEASRVARAHAGPLDIVLTDHDRAEGGDDDFLGPLLEADPGLPIVLMADSPPPDDGKRRSDVPPSIWLRKPFDLGELNAALARIDRARHRAS